MGRANRTGGIARRRAFTLLEILVAVGAVALIAVGLASVFTSVSRTVTGGRRLNEVNTYAGAIERQMRRDFESMSREGYLLIRQQLTQNTVALSPDSTSLPVTRRVDEIVFFATGDHATAREQLAQGVTARGHAARIYYGHGTRVANAAPWPDVIDSNIAAGRLGDPNRPNVLSSPTRARLRQNVADTPL